jgi:carbon storage regulator
VLVLTRKANQSIMIGDDIEVTVLSNDGRKVRLGIRAPAAVPVHRDEIYWEIRAQREESGDERGKASRAGRRG